VVTDQTDRTDRNRSTAPARRYSWPPFEKGHELSMVHGAKSARKVQPIADALATELIAEAPWCASPAFRGAVASWSWAEGQAVLLRRYVDENGMFDEEGTERPAVRTLSQVEARLIKLRDGLGLNPVALAKLMAASASVAAATGDEASVEALRAEGARILASRITTAPTGDEAEDEGDDEDEHEGMDEHEATEP
jgi:hypothetical protein